MAHNLGHHIPEERNQRNNEATASSRPGKSNSVSLTKALSQLKENAGQKSKGPEASRKLRDTAEEFKDQIQIYEIQRFFRVIANNSTIQHIPVNITRNLYTAIDKRRRYNKRWEANPYEDETGTQGINKIHTIIVQQLEDSVLLLQPKLSYVEGFPRHVGQTNQATYAVQSPRGNSVEHLQIQELTMITQSDEVKDSGSTAGPTTISDEKQRNSAQAKRRLIRANTPSLFSVCLTT